MPSSKQTVFRSVIHQTKKYVFTLLKCYVEFGWELTRFSLNYVLPIFYHNTVTFDVPVSTELDTAQMPLLMLWLFRDAKWLRIRPTLTIPLQPMENLWVCAVPCGSRVLFVRSIGCCCPTVAIVTAASHRPHAYAHNPIHQIYRCASCQSTTLAVSWRLMFECVCVCVSVHR